MMIAWSAFSAADHPSSSAASFPLLSFARTASSSSASPNDAPVFTSGRFAADFGGL